MCLSVCLSVCSRSSARNFWAKKLIFGHKVPGANTSRHFSQFFDTSIWKKIRGNFHDFWGHFNGFCHIFDDKNAAKGLFFCNLARYWTIQSETDLRKLGTDWKNIYRITLHLVIKNFVFLIIHHTIFALKLTWREILFQYAISKDLFTHSSQLSQCLTSTNFVIYIVHF